MAWQVRSATGAEYGSSLGITLVIHIKNDASKCFIAVIAWRVEHLFPCDMMISYCCFCFSVFILKIPEGWTSLEFVYVVIQMINKMLVPLWIL